MISLYQTYTVSVQDSITFAPDNNLELLLYEGKIEIKPDVLNAGKKDVFDYGTTSKAIPVYDKNGVACSALVADAIERPGEYDFVDIDINKASSLSYLGETLYSVVACPDDSDPSDPFANAKIIVSEKDISDSAIKQIVRAAIGGTTSLTSNIVIAGGSVAFSQYTNGVVNHNYDQHIKITNLPSEITDMTEVATSYPTFATSTKLCLRFNVYYSNGSDVIRWEGIPCYKTSDNSWVIKLQRDQYNTYRSKEFGGGGFIDLGAIWQNFIITMDPTNNNVYFRRFDTNPTIALPTSGSSFERTMIHTHMVGTEPVVGVGAWTYATAAETPYYNLDVVGSRGARVRISTTPKLSIDSTAAKIGYNTGTHYFGSSSTASIVVLNSLTKFAASDAGVGSPYVRVGYNILTYPRFTADATTAKIEGASNTYLSVNTSNQIYGYVGGIQKFSLNASNSICGYDTTQTYFGASVGSITIALAGLTKFAGTTTYVLLGHNVSTYPRIYADATTLRFYGTATTYFSATSSNQLYAYQGSNQALAIEGSQTKLKFGAATAGYSFILGNTITYLSYDDPAGAYRMYMTSSLTAFGHNIAVSPITPAFVGFTTNARLQGSTTTYFSATSSNELYAYVLDGSSKCSIWLGATNGYHFGYNVNVPLTGVYFKATSANAYIYHSSKDVFKFDGTTLTLSPGGSAVATNVQFTTSSYSVMFSGDTKFYAAADEVRMLRNTTNKITITSTQLSIINNNLPIVISCNGTASPITDDASSGHFYHDYASLRYDYWKIPYRHNEILSTEVLPNGAMYLGFNTQYFLYVRTPAGVKRINFY